MATVPDEPWRVYLEAAAIRRLRGLLGLTQEQFALEIGATVSTANRWENGRREPHPIAARAMYALAKKYHIPPPQPRQQE